MTLNDYIDFDKLWTDILEVEIQNLKDAHEELVECDSDDEQLRLYNQIYEFIDELGSEIEIVSEECVINTKASDVVYFCFSICETPSNESNGQGEYTLFEIGYDLTNDEFVCFERDI